MHYGGRNAYPVSSENIMLVWWIVWGEQRGDVKSLFAFTLWGHREVRIIINVEISKSVTVLVDYAAYMNVLGE